MKAIASFIINIVIEKAVKWIPAFLKKLKMRIAAFLKKLKMRKDIKDEVDEEVDFMKEAQELAKHDMAKFGKITPETEKMLREAARKLSSD